MHPSVSISSLPATMNTCNRLICRTRNHRPVSISCADLCVRSFPNPSMAFSAPAVLAVHACPTSVSSPATRRTFRAPQIPISRRARVTPHATATGRTTGAREVSGDELDLTIKAAARPIVLDAYAKWCGPCQFMLPQLETVAERYGDAVDILKLDTEKYPELASAMMVRGLPTLFFIKDGELKFRMEGALPAEELEKLINYFFFGGPRPGGEPQDLEIDD